MMLGRGGRPDVRKVKTLCGGWTACEAEVGGWVDEEFAQWMTEKPVWGHYDSRRGC